MNPRLGQFFMTQKAPSDPSALPPYDHVHGITYLRMLDADAER